MIRASRSAREQIEALLQYYIVEKKRPDAAARMLQDLRAAWRRIIFDPAGGLPAPRPYPALAQLDFRWTLARIYWVSWTALDDTPVVTNVFHTSADIENRASTTIEDIADW